MVFLPFMILHDRNMLEETRTGIISRPVKPLPPLDLTDREQRHRAPAIALPA